jgi:hypothetical protein
MKIIKKIGFISLIIISAIFALILLLREPLPQGSKGSKAENLADELSSAINKDAWDQIQWLSWTFMDDHTYIWNKAENLAVIQFGKHRVHLNLISIRGSVWTNGKAVEGKKKEKLIDKAWKYWCNDSYWLNPMVKIRDDGTVRKYVELEDGNRGLLVTFTEGGVTPGDSYLYAMNENGLPEYWKMWVQILPIGAVKTTFEQYQVLEGGAKIATAHKLGPINISISHLKQGATYQDIGIEKDPFLFIQ